MERHNIVHFIQHFFKVIAMVQIYFPKIINMFYLLTPCNDFLQCSLDLPFLGSLASTPGSSYSLSAPIANHLL